MDLTSEAGEKLSTIIPNTCILAFRILLDKMRCSLILILERNIFYRSGKSELAFHFHGMFFFRDLWFKKANDNKNSNQKPQLSIPGSSTKLRWKLQRNAHSILPEHFWVSWWQVYQKMWFKKDWFLWVGVRSNFLPCGSWEGRTLSHREFSPGLSHEVRQGWVWE